MRIASHLRRSKTMSKIHGNRRRSIELSEEGEALLFADGYDSAIIGVGLRDGVEIVVYDSVEVIRILRCRDGMSQAEAEDFFEFNVLGAWVGERTPMFLNMI